MRLLRRKNEGSMKDLMGKRVCGLAIAVVAIAVVLRAPLRAEQISLDALVTPSTTILKDGRPLTFAVHGFIEFKSLAELFPYIDSQTKRWQLDDLQRQDLVRDLLRRGIESRIVSMNDERSLEAVITHTSDELRQAIARVTESVPRGYADAFLAVQEKWKHSLNCWSASPSISGRVLSNWYPIEEGIQLFGATYDSTEHFWQAIKYHPTEHFWQAIKYHPDTTVADLTELIGLLEHKEWNSWLARLVGDPTLYLPNAYAVEFLRHNLAPERLRWFRFSAYEEKVLWGDLADLFHLVYAFSPPDDPIRRSLTERHFDAVYLGDCRMGFISEDFRSLMLEIWKVKYLQMPRFREVISTIPIEIRLEHFLNDGDSPDIPIPIYVGYLNQIRGLARSKNN